MTRINTSSPGSKEFGKGDVITGPSSSVAAGSKENARACTCHPNDKPPRPCAQKFALRECRLSALLDAARVYTDSRESFPSLPRDYLDRIEEAGWAVAEAYRQFRKSTP